MIRLSLIILTYNSEKDIYDCLQSVYQYNDIGNSLEVIVVDNFTQMRDKINLQYPDVKVIANTKNGGYGQGNNIGIRVMSYKFSVFKRQNFFFKFRDIFHSVC